MVERRLGAHNGPEGRARAARKGRRNERGAAASSAAGAHKATSVSSSASAESGWFAGALSPSASSSDRNADPAIHAQHPTLTPPARTRIKNAINITTERRAECFKLCSRSICHLSARPGVASVAPRARALVPPVGFDCQEGELSVQLALCVTSTESEGSLGCPPGWDRRQHRPGSPHLELAAPSSFTTGSMIWRRATLNLLPAGRPVRQRDQLAHRERRLRGLPRLEPKARPVFVHDAVDDPHSRRHGGAAGSRRGARIQWF